MAVNTISTFEVNATKTIIESGTMVTSGVLSNLVIFNDQGYMYLAIVGAIVSMFGVIHEIFSSINIKYTKRKIIVEILKGFILGLFVIPFWYLAITEGVLQNIMHIETGQVSKSLALLTSFALSWNTIPIYNWGISKITLKGGKV